MSHTTKVTSVPFKDMSAVRTAVEELNRQGVKCRLVEKEKPRMYYTTQHGVCDYVVRLEESPYDVGLEKEKNGTYSLVFDSWQGHIARHLAPKVPVAKDSPIKPVARLVQEYSKAAAVNVARSKGHVVTGCHITPQGHIQLKIAV